MPIFFTAFHTPSQHAQRPAHLWNHAEGDKTREVCEVVREYVGYKYAHASKNKPLPWRALALQVLLLERHSLLAVFIQDVMSETASDRPMSDANSVRRGRRERERERERDKERYLCIYVCICIYMHKNLYIDLLSNCSAWDNFFISCSGASSRVFWTYWTCKSISNSELLNTDC